MDLVCPKTGQVGQRARPAGHVDLDADRFVADKLLQPANLGQGRIEFFPQRGRLVAAAAWMETGAVGIVAGGLTAG